jgi:transposase
MMMAPAGVRVHLALGVTNMRKGMDGLAMLVQGVLKQDPFCGHLFVFRGRKANLVNVLFWDGTGLCLFTKRLEHGHCPWPSSGTAGDAISLTSVQLSMLIEGIDWRAPERVRRPTLAG